MRFVYTATRALSPGHSVDTEYSIVIGGQAIDPKRRHRRSVTEALDGSRETDFQGTQRAWEVVTDWLKTQSERDIFEEFVESVATGATFTFDPYASTDSAVAPISVVMDSDEISPRRVGNSGYFTYAFRMRES